MSRNKRFLVILFSLMLFHVSVETSGLYAQEDSNAVSQTNGETNADQEKSIESSGVEINPRELFRSSGVFGILLLVLSLAMVALILEHLLTLRRRVLIPQKLIDHAGELILNREFGEADRVCRESRTLLGEVLHSGIVESGAGYSAVIKAMEDSCSQISARMLRKLQYLNVIGTIAPMIGLLGTVWGLMLAFLEFTHQANPQVAELAPGIYKALVTTLMGLSVAVPALASFAIFQNWVDELIAQTALTAEHLFTNFKKEEQDKNHSHGNIKGPVHRIPPVVREKGIHS